MDRFSENNFYFSEKRCLSTVNSKQARPEKQQSCPFYSIRANSLILLNRNDLTRLICTLLRFNNSSSKLIKLKSKVAY